MAKRKTRATYLVKMFHYWCGKLGLPKPIDTVQDNRMDSHCCVDNWEDKNKMVLKYHTRRLGQFVKCELINTVFHEIGHIINHLPYDTEAQQIESEYRAELFSIKMMKKHKPRLYKMLLQRMRQQQSMIKLKKKDPLYYKAWIRIKDYRETIKC